MDNAISVKRVGTWCAWHQGGYLGASVGALLKDSLKRIFNYFLSGRERHLKSFDKKRKKRKKTKKNEKKRKKKEKNEKKIKVFTEDQILSGLSSL